MQFTLVNIPSVIQNCQNLLSDSARESKLFFFSHFLLDCSFDLHS